MIARRVGVAAHLAIGVVVLGGAAYAFVAVVAHVFADPQDAGVLSALISLYLLTNIVGPGVFTPLEQQTIRAVSAAQLHDQDLQPVIRRSAVLALWWATGVGLLVLASWPLGLDRVLDGRAVLLASLIAGIVGSGSAYWARGVLGGQQRFRAYASTYYVEGAVRLVPCLVLLVLGVHAPEPYAFPLALGSLVAALGVARLLRAPASSGGPAGTHHMGRSLSLLVAAALLSQTMANLAPVVVTYRSQDDLVGAAVFGSTFVLARIPLFVFAAVLATLLASLTKAAARGDRDELRRQLSRAAWLVALVGAAGVLGAVLVGPWAAEVLFSAAVPPSVLTLGALAFATLLMMLALLVQAALVALGRPSAGVRASPSSSSCWPCP